MIFPILSSSVIFILLLFAAQYKNLSDLYCFRPVIAGITCIFITSSRPPPQLRSSAYVALPSPLEQPLLSRWCASQEVSSLHIPLICFISMIFLMDCREHLADGNVNFFCFWLCSSVQIFLCIYISLAIFVKLILLEVFNVSAVDMVNQQQVY